MNRKTTDMIGGDPARLRVAGRDTAVWAALLAAALAFAGCGDSGENGGGGTGTGGDTAEMADGTEDAGDTVGPDGVDSCQTQTWYVDSDGDGYGTSGDTKEACEKPDGYVDNSDDCDDGDAAFNPGSDETCDGTDQNCNGTADEDESASNIVEEDCGTEEGVCAGATVAACSGDGSSYADCGADQYGPDYRDSDHEGWRCDGKDNDCDAETDEACCSSGTAPLDVQLGNSGEDRAFPAVAPAAQNAPADAKYVVAWAQGQDLEIWHVDEMGSKVGAGTESLGAKIADLDVASHSSGYAAFAASAGGELESIRFDASLQMQGSKKRVNRNTTSNLTGVSAATNGQTGWVAFSFENGNVYVIKAAAIDLSNGNRTTDPFIVSQPSNTLPNPGEPEVAVVGGTPTVAWWQARTGSLDATLRGARVQSAGSVMNRFRLSVKGISGGRIEPISAVAAGGDLHLVYPEYSGGTGVLELRTVGAGETGSLSGGTGITGGPASDRRPAAVAADTDRDGTDDQLAVVWAHGLSSDPAIMGGSTSISPPSQMSGREIVRGGRGNVATRPEIAEFESKAGLVWQQPKETQPRDVKFAPLSIDGVPVCPPIP